MEISHLIFKFVLLISTILFVYNMLKVLYMHSIYTKRGTTDDTQLIKLLLYIVIGLLGSAISMVNLLK